jgi:RimJ/RimL family protein N-acetyltransferase
MIGPTLETERLILRPPAQADFEAFATMAQEEETMRFIGGLAAPDAAWRSMASLTGSWVLLGYSMFSVIEKESGRWIGRLGLKWVGGSSPQRKARATPMKDRPPPSTGRSIRLGGIG